MNLKMILAVAVGGAAGAVARYLVMSWTTRWLGHGFPYGTLVVNIAGSFILGALIETMALKWSIGQELRALLVVGIMGSFTTFSTFSLDVVTLSDRGDWGAAAGYMLCSVVLAVGGFRAGRAVARGVLS